MWKEAIDQQGFAVIHTLFSQAETSLLIHDLTESGIHRSWAGMRHALRQPSVAALAKDQRLLEIARDTLGPQAFPFRATLFDKSLDTNWLVVWHQDTALPLLERRDLPGWGPWSMKEGITYAHAPADALSQVMAVRVHLDASSVGNGPLRILPATHTLGLLSDEAIEKVVSQTQSVECAVPLGGVLAMRPLVVHASSKSRIAAPRRVLHIEYAATSRFDNGLELALA